jgi:ATP-dependent DNA ligase
MVARTGGELVYVGEVGTAISRRMSTELRKLLEAIVAKKPTVN